MTLSLFIQLKCQMSPPAHLWPLFLQLEPQRNSEAFIAGEGKDKHYNIGNDLFAVYCARVNG